MQDAVTSLPQVLPLGAHSDDDCSSDGNGARVTGRCDGNATNSPTPRQQRRQSTYFEFG
ncbi:hypothetical protein BH23ACT1_BH23ACT1_15820 [soil metagenome]